MQNQIFITGLKLSAIIGCLPEEQKNPQPLLIDIVMSVEDFSAAKTDDIKHTIDYAVIAEMVTEHVKNHHYKLVETLAEKLTELLLKKFAITQVMIKVGKPQALSLAENAGVQIVRKK